MGAQSHNVKLRLWEFTAGLRNRRGGARGWRGSGPNDVDDEIIQRRSIKRKGTGKALGKTRIRRSHTIPAIIGGR